jgi:hypothetical protein
MESMIWYNQLGPLIWVLEAHLTVNSSCSALFNLLDLRWVDDIVDPSKEFSSGCISAQNPSPIMEQS